MKYYVFSKHPITGERIVVTPTGKVEGDTAEFKVLTPRSNLEVLWLRREDILKE